MEDIEASDGVRLRAEAHGEGLPLILSCAYCTPRENWRSHIDALVAAGARVVLWDYRGHGESDAPDDPAAYSMDQVVDDLVYTHIPPKSYHDQWDGEGLYAAAIAKLGIDQPVMAWVDEDGVDGDVIRERLTAASDEMMAKKAVDFGPENMRNIEKQLLLQTIDTKWREHLLRLEHLRSVIGFRGYAQRDPLNEYKREGFQLFEGLLESLRVDVTEKLAMIRPLSEEEQKAMVQKLLAQQGMATAGAPVTAASQPEAAAAPARVPEPAGAGAAAPLVGALPGFDENDRATWGNPGRNDLCPCGSGKKFKHCHGRLL